ncbi:translation machinery-associated protein 16-like [Haliotis asinina]|uniref:translation machinery-associated protein 16-like n=1 Tax=Haliotis asinina TaxID=109174 RepID=UPI003531A56E
MPKAPKAKVGQNKKPIHPNSRKAAALSRKAFREVRISQDKSARSKLDVLAEKCDWFRVNFDPDKTVYTREELCELSNRYLHRFDEEIEQIDIVSRIGNRQGNQHASRLAAIKLTQESDRNELESVGMEVPDLMNKSTFNQFKLWSGEIKYAQNFKLKKIHKSDIDKVEEETNANNDSNDESDGNET